MYTEKRNYFQGLCLYLKDADADLYEECLRTSRDTVWDAKQGLKSVYKHDEEKSRSLIFFFFRHPEIISAPVPSMEVMLERLMSSNDTIAFGCSSAKAGAVAEWLHEGLLIQAEQ
jgi:hypothetical protein